MQTLDQTALDRIAEEVRRAEAGTAGEIIVVVERAAGAYRSLSLVFAWLLAFLVPWPLIWLTGLSAQLIFIAQLTVALALAVLLSIRQGWRMALTPRFIKRQKAHEAACREFLMRGLSRTTGRSGVLIYVALAERYAEVMADSGISAKIDDDAWRQVVNALVETLHEGRLAEGLVACVGEVGEMLARVAPVEHAVDELPNKVILI